ncbi:unnamed protein product [Caenorhabditis bovis]|uniref:TLDc domain-containing protein n=1 Tax=Caenorhabditis bovis TaxID=2654633 RepID=A0A8S1ERC4_9PELO|nr:unnamed protein product [Caenorhabditis bovis]
MGNEHSKRHTKSENDSVSTRSEKRSPITHYDPYIDIYYQRLKGTNDKICYNNIQKLFDEDLTESLWRYFTNNNLEKREITRDEFHKNFKPLNGMSTDIYVKILQPVFHFVKVCSDAAGASAIQGDEAFIKTLVEKMTGGSKDEEEATESILNWRRSDCEKFCNAVQSLVISKVTGTQFQKQDYSSDILTPLQMWYLQCSLPSIYFPEKEKAVSNHWSPLYTSMQHGISTNRFENFVFGYKGPTVSIFRLKDKRVIVLAVDQEWRHGGNRFGGSSTCYFEILPNMKRIEASQSVYCNLKVRASAFGLSFKEEMKIDKDFSEVHDIEVWGCAGADTLAEQQKLKNWQKQQSEKHKKVPLPGNWDDNPDKTILEMAGFQFSNERENMEMEARRKNEQDRNEREEYIARQNLEK